MEIPNEKEMMEMSAKLARLAMKIARGEVSKPSEMLDLIDEQFSNREKTIATERFMKLVLDNGLSKTLPKDDIAFR